MQSGCLLSRLISVQHISNTAYFSINVYVCVSFLHLSPPSPHSDHLSIAFDSGGGEGGNISIPNRWKTHFSMLRSAQIIRFYAILNRINYAFYNATEILKIIDVDSEMISGIIFVIYEDIFMSLFLAFATIFHTHLLRLPHHKTSGWTKTVNWLFYNCIADGTQREEEEKKLNDEHNFNHQYAQHRETEWKFCENALAYTKWCQYENSNNEQYSSNWNSIKRHLELVVENQSGIVCVCHAFKSLAAVNVWCTAIE